MKAPPATMPPPPLLHQQAGAGLPVKAPPCTQPPPAATACAFSPAPQQEAVQPHTQLEEMMPTQDPIDQPMTRTSRTTLHLAALIPQPTMMEIWWDLEVSETGWQTWSLIWLTVEWGEDLLD